jgi:hypothetical protein
VLHFDGVHLLVADISFIVAEIILWRLNSSLWLHFDANDNNILALSLSLLVGGRATSLLDRYGDSRGRFSTLEG